MKSTAVLLAMVALLSVSPALADDTPAEICKPGSSYTLILANPQAYAIPGLGIAPNGISCKVIEASGEWIKIEYSSKSMERNPSDPGQVDTKTTTRVAWVNLEHVSMLIPAEEAKAKE